MPYKDPEKRRECGRKTTHVYQLANPEKCRERVRVWAAANPEKIREKDLAWAVANPERVRKNKRAWYVANQEKVRKARRVWVSANPKKILETRLKHAYGISLQKYEEMLIFQKGICPICGDAPNGRRLVVDHNHTTGEIRGLLCYRCNCALGMMVENPNTAEKMLEYIISWGTKK